MGDWESSGWIRLTAGEVGLTARNIKPIIEAVIAKKVRAISAYPDLRQQIGRDYVSAVSMYVPIKKGTLTASGEATADGRVYWTAVGKNGFNYAYKQYTDKGFVHPARAGHMPQAYWTDKVQPGTAEWINFTEEVKRTVIAYFDEEL